MATNKQHKESDFQNESHIAKKLKAQSKNPNIRTRRVRDIISQIDDFEDAAKLISEYARYIR